MKVDFVPDPEFSWGLSLEEFNAGKKGKKKKANDESNVVIIKQDSSKANIREDIKLKISKDLAFSTATIDKVNKGLKNSINSCYMNVCL